MRTVSYNALVSLQRKHRSILLLSMVFFLTALFALVSRWTIAYPLIAFSCVFYLVLSRLSRRRYTEAFTQALMAHALPAALDPVSYAASQDADGLLVQRGLIPDIPCVPGAKQHHALRGMMKDAPFCVSEVACVRKASRGMCSVAGTLVTADSILPGQESWLILLGDPLAGFCTPEEYADLEPVPRGDGWPGGEYVVLQRKGSRADLLSACLAPLLANPNGCPAALAARDGALSLFVPNSFYAPVKADPTKPVSPESLSGFRLPALELLQQLTDRLHPAQDA